MNLERYDRHIKLPGFGLEAQEKLGRSKVLVVGAGGLGVPVLTYLNAMGAGTLGMVDSDVVSLSNLHRQVLYFENDINRTKIAAVSEKLKAQNSKTKLVAYEMMLTKENALEIISGYDVVVDACDNFPTRYLINDACVMLKIPFVYGALHGFEGQVSVFNYEGGPTYRCLFSSMPRPNEVPDCNENGVLGVVPGIVGNLQALETVKLLTGVGEPLSGKLLLFDGLSNSFRKINFSVQPENLEIKQLQSTYELDCQTGVVGSESVDSQENRASIAAQAFLSLAAAERLTKGNRSKSNLLNSHASGQYQLVDVRTKSEFDSEHLPFAKHIPLSELESRKGEVDFSLPVYFVCQSGVRSTKAIRILRSSHPDAELMNIEGGMNGILRHRLTV